MGEVEIGVVLGEENVARVREEERALRQHAQGGRPVLRTTLEAELVLGRRCLNGIDRGVVVENAEKRKIDCVEHAQDARAVGRALLEDAVNESTRQKREEEIVHRISLSMNRERSEHHGEARMGVVLKNDANELNRNVDSGLYTLERI